MNGNIYIYIYYPGQHLIGLKALSLGYLIAHSVSSCHKQVYMYILSRIDRSMKQLQSVPTYLVDRCSPDTAKCRQSSSGSVCTLECTEYAGSSEQLCTDEINLLSECCRHPATGPMMSGRVASDQGGQLICNLTPALTALS
jgi:hypothetical protein